MKRFLVASLALGVLVASAFVLDGDASPVSDVHAASVDGRTLAYRVLGSGQPVIVMLSGLGHGMKTFDRVAPELARSATVILYDRAGYGGSEAVASPRDAEAEAHELGSLLQQTGVQGPYVLLGHSLGGLYAEYFAATHPTDVAGLILEESRPADFDFRCEAAGISGCGPTAAMVAHAGVGAQSEVAGLDRAAEQVRALTPLQGRPTLVISRPVKARSTGFAALWSQAQEDLAKRYAGSRHLTAPAGGHGVHHDQRAWFVRTVAQFLESETLSAQR